MARAAARPTRFRKQGCALLAAAALSAAVGCSGEPSRGGPSESGSGSRAERDAGQSDQPSEDPSAGPGKSPRNGPYEVRTQSVQKGDVDGDFGSATVHYPADGSRDYGVIAASPGLGADESMVRPFGELLASHGFVLITFNTKTLQDTPAQRGRQLLRALDYAAERSAAADRADPGRLGVLGHSMGGGGALHAASRNPKIKAAVPLTPYAGKGDWSGVPAATLVIGGSSDEIAPPSDHAEVFYDGLSDAKDKAYLELEGDHFVATPPDGLVSRQMVAWFRYFVGGDAASGEALCPAPREERVVESRDTCPYEQPDE
ncbi:alpha/beta hydrolase family protein [Streptomyces ovatisporus]|uniref:Alpha/beta hydrolase family protein n=1 Tax=Streptomyces ovatisporus TaxID=1128682 RepID=A0ABV9A8N1_9ACTN